MGLGARRAWAGRAAARRRPTLTRAASRVVEQCHREQRRRRRTSRPEFDAIEATTAALVELVTARPGLIVLDDLQSADRFTCQVLEHLAWAIRCVSLLIVATWQDGARGMHRLRMNWNAYGSHRRRRHQVARIGRRSHSRADHRHLWGGTQPQFVAGVRDRTGGNPFYVREIVQLLADNDRLGELGSDFRSGTDVPEAVSGVIRRRTSLLPTPTRTLLRVAAVAGSEFAATRLAAVTGSSVPNDRGTRTGPGRRSGYLFDGPAGRLPV